MQSLIVALIVAAAAGYSAWQLMSPRLQRRLLHHLMIIAPSQRARLARLAAAATDGGCGHCKGCAPTGTEPASPLPSKIEIYRRPGGE